MSRSPSQSVLSDVGCSVRSCAASKDSSSSTICTEAPGASRPHIVTPRRLASCSSSTAQKAGALPLLSPENSRAATPMMVTTLPPSRTERPTTDGSDPNWLAQNP